MSGGVDSSVAALLLARAGHEVVGLTARMWRDASRCCGDEDVYRAQRVCHRLGIRHAVLDVTARFNDKVIGDFVASYLAGLTPNPCAVCNRDIKFGPLVEFALSLGCGQVASGHYARLAGAGDRLVLAEPADRRKSQIYFLALVPRQVLPRLVFPLENLLKRDVAGLAREAGLPMRETESQDLCFVAPGKHQTFLKQSAAAPGGGRVLDTEGRVVGEHLGHYAFTIGQRFGVAGKRLYVLAKRAATNEIVVGPRAQALSRRIRAGSVNYFLEAEAGPGAAVGVKYRYNSPAVPGTVTDAAEDRLEVLLDQPCFAPAPGQVLALYREDRLVCAGTIEWAGDPA
jgi:tRNA-specific 2-thiouridylase